MYTLLVVDHSNIASVKAGTTCPVISEPVGGKSLVLMSWGSLTVDMDTLRHEGTQGQYIQFTTAQAIALAEYNQHFGS